MKRHFFTASAWALLAVMTFIGSTKAMAGGLNRPKLVVGIVVDQMRWDYLYRYYDLYGEGGFKRMLNEGYSCENTMINYIPSITGVGHASIFTGTVPSIHGIAANNFMEDGQEVYCCEDNQVKGVGTNNKSGMKSPNRLLTTTIGDELKVATNFKGKVYGVSLKDRASILPAGHAADGAFWYDYDDCRFITSSYYMEKLPKWLEHYNKTIGKVAKDSVSFSGLGNRLTEEMAKATIEGEALGADNITDMLTVSFSCTDMVGHKYGTHHEKNVAIYTDLDQRLADFFSFLDEKVGKGQYLVFLTADHGAANNILMMRDHGVPADGFFPKKTKEGLNNHLSEQFGTTDKLVAGINSYKIYLNRKAIADKGLDFDKVKATAIAWLQQDKQFAYVVDLEHVREAAVPAPLIEMMVNGYNAKRSGEIQLVLQPGCYEIYGDKIDGGTTHGSWNPYDTHIPFLLMGWNVSHGSTNAAVSMSDIAATVCTMIHVQSPNGCIGKPVVMSK